MSLALTQTVPGTEPVTTAEAKAHLRVDFADDDTYIDGLIAAARATCETLSRNQFVTATFVMTLERFPENFDPIEFPKPPLQSVDTITYIDENGDSQTWAAGERDVITNEAVGLVVPKPGNSYPTTQRDKRQAVTVTFDAGHGLAADVPKAVKQAMFLLIGHWYENREEVVVGTITKQIERSVDALLDNVRVEVFSL